ncbi:MAG TPA: efflux RND transporter permease subunit [Bryobacteraceae bacterium]|nr:efflux RND transporter permease subunit [Bryobacteraceae bacterium]
MWIVRLALRRPFTFVVMATLIAILGVNSILVMPVDIFPYIDIPVVSVVWTYPGVSPDDMEKRIVTVSERAMTTTVNDIEHIESQSYNGVAVIKVFFQPNVKVELAIAQVTAIMQTLLRALPPGIFPPGILKYDASSVPILQIGLGSDTLSESQLYDYGQNFVRTQLATIQGASLPLPYGGKTREIMVDINPNALYAKQLSATDVSNALSLQNLILPAGTAKIGTREYLVRVNSSPLYVDALNDLPIKTVNGATVFIKDVAQVRDGAAVQTNIVRQDGGRGALLTVLRNGKASTLSIINRVKKALPDIQAGLPPELKMKFLFDQSLFVRASINGVLREGAIAAALTGLMILLFLGSVRSTLIVCISIPLSILTSLIVLALTGHTINIMTLGGLALAVGILVDDATVEIENTHRNMGMKKPLTRAVLDGAQQVAVPAFVSTLSICIVFVPVLLLVGAARFLFTPLAEAVVFAMLASYLLSRTLIPNMVHYLLRKEVDLYREGEGGEPAEAPGWNWKIHHKFNHYFDRLRDRYAGFLDWSLDHRGALLIVFGVFVAGSMVLTLFIGRDFFPTVDSGQIRFHVQPPSGTRIEESEHYFSRIDALVREVIPANEIDTILDNIGLPNSGINLAFGDNPVLGDSDGDILVSLKKDHHPTEKYNEQLRARFRESFPDCEFTFEAANITNQILNFGLPAPIDVQVVGRDFQGNYKIAKDIEKKMAAIPGAVDVHVHQIVDYPEVRVNVDRSKANQIGLTERDVSNSLLISLSSSGQVAPNQWLNPQNGVNYQVAVQTPQILVNSFDALLKTPISSLGSSGASTGGSTPNGSTGAQAITGDTAEGSPYNTGAAPNGASPAYANASAPQNSAQLLSNIASLQRGVSTEIVNHYNVQPVFDIYANVDRRDLGGVRSDVEKIMSGMRPHLPKGVKLDLRGQAETMQSSFVRLGLGMVFAVTLVYLLMVVNFQSWVDPAIILMALPGAFAGVLWMLFMTQTTFNVPSLMGAIMSFGVATANSILLVTFANDERAAGKNVREAALSAGFTRLRPVCMTALAMLLGMLPMALSLGEGGEQNAPLGRAVIGGLALATFSTLFVVPIIYTYLRKEAPIDYDRRIAEEEHEGDAPAKEDHDRHG